MIFKSGAQRLLGVLGLDRKVFTGLLSKLINMAAAPVGAVITVWTLSVETQGLYYLFSSLLALRALFELGAGMSVVQIAAHARVGFSPLDASPLEPAFVAIVNRWMGRIALFYGVITGIGGLVFLVSQSHDEPSTLLPWIGLILVSSLQFASEGRWGLLDGVDRVEEVNLLRIRNGLLQFAVQWSALLLGCGLFSFCLGSLAAYVSQEICFRRRHRWMYVAVDGQDSARLHYFRSELVTLIKRASQTYMAGYFVFQIQQPICFHFLGAAEVARLGFTQAVGSAVISLPSIWLAMTFPKLAHLVADNEIHAARKLFTTKWIQLASLTIVGFGGAWIAVRILRSISRFSDRLMPDKACFLLFLALGLQTLAMGLIYWPRAFKVEPFVSVAYVQMFATPILLYTLVRAWGLDGASSAILGSWVIGSLGIAWIAWQYWVNSRPVPA